MRRGVPRLIYKTITFLDLGKIPGSYNCLGRFWSVLIVMAPELRRHLIDRNGVKLTRLGEVEERGNFANEAWYSTPQ
jgi:hypothetical protein